MVSELEEFCINFFISGSAAVISKTIIAPAERTKFILQNQDSALQILTGERRKYDGVLDILRRIPKEQGFLSFWRGNGTNLIRYFPSQALNFSFYEYYKHTFCSFVNYKSSKKVTLCKLAAGGLAGACSSGIVFPLDFCQTRLTVDVGGCGKCAERTGVVQREFIGLFHCLSKVYRTEGIGGLYYGVHISVLGLALYRGIYFGLYDYAKSYYITYQSHGEVKKKLPFPMSFLVAQAVTSFSGSVAYPFDTVSRRMMLDAGRPTDLRKCPTTVQTFKYIYKVSGIYGFYKGALTNIVRCTAGALVLVLYDEFVYYAQLR